ncbi:LysE family translocator [Vibrio amylolyticus]|uniref:LysE family translocator n=1 Tax=Vibrio TaxID=662 RepID=UPI000C845074|nr:LysE family translocator [Vibrio sp. 10N.261.55.A7]PMJ99107.1 threonine transporter RhtB [Vibrio sp. 10N.261.55.A7]
MSLSATVALFIAMALSALIPGPSVLAVLSRSISNGFKQGFLVIVGVLLADYLFIALALTGLSAVSAIMGEFASLLKYIGITYLFWLAYTTWTASTATEPKPEVESKITRSSILTGLLTTLANPKAILFYMGFFPAFIDMGTLSLSGIISIIVIVTLSVGGVLALYAWAGSSASGLFQSTRSKQLLNKLSGGFLASCGVLLATKQS